MKKTRFSPKGRAGATNGRETGNACEIPNRTGKNNIINYGSLEPPLACHGVICLHGLARRGRHCGPRARVAGVWVAPARPGPSASPSPPTGGGLTWGPGDSSELRAGDAPAAGTGPPGRPSTGSPLFPAPTPRQRPAPGSAVRAGPRQGTPGARADRAGCAFPGDVAGPPRAACDICARARGREGSRPTQDAHLDRLSSRARCEEGEVKVKCRAGAAAPAPRPGPSSARRPLQPHLALCLSSGADVL